MGDIFDDILHQEFDPDTGFATSRPTAASAASLRYSDPRLGRRVSPGQRAVRTFNAHRGGLTRYSGAAILAVGAASCIVCGALLGGLSSAVTANVAPAVDGISAAQLPAGSVPGLESGLHNSGTSFAHPSVVDLTSGGGSAIDTAVVGAKVAASSNSAPAGTGTTAPTTPPTTTPTTPTVLNSLVGGVIDTVTGTLGLVVNTVTSLLGTNNAPAVKAGSTSHALVAPTTTSTVKATATATTGATTKAVTPAVSGVTTLTKAVTSTTTKSKSKCFVVPLSKLHTSITVCS